MAMNFPGCRRSFGDGVTCRCRGWVSSGRSRTIGEQPDGIAYVVFDSQIDDVPNWKRSIRTSATVPGGQHRGVGRALQTASGAIGRNPEGVQRRLSARRIPAPDDGFPGDQGPRHRQVKLGAPDLHTALLCYPIISGVCFTYGGVKTNSKGQVVDTDGRAIPGLYAAGEATGLYHQVYTGATSVMRGAVFGKIAGAHAARRCGAVPSSRSPGHVR
jgi:tricarballylate dehydrogenase